jgi:hypothetical protein
MASGARRGTAKGEALDGFNQSRKEENGRGGGAQQKLGTERRAASGVAQQSSEAAARSRAVSMKTGETKKSR